MVVAMVAGDGDGDQEGAREERLMKRAGAAATAAKGEREHQVVW